MSSKPLLLVLLINCLILLAIGDTGSRQSRMVKNEILNLDSLRLENLLAYDIEKNRFHSKHSKSSFKSKGLFCPTRKCNHQPNKFNSEFECYSDKMCPKLHKCCFHGCYAHKVCVKGVDNFHRIFTSSENEIRVRHKFCPPNNACSRTITALSEDYHCFSDKNCDGGHKCCSHSCYTHKVCISPREVDGSKSAVIKYPSDFSLADLASLKVLEEETISTSSDSTTSPKEITTTTKITTKTKHRAHKKSKNTKKVKPTSKMTTYKETSTATSNKRNTKKGTGLKVHTTDATTVPFITSTDLFTKTSDIKLSSSSDIGFSSKTHKKSKKSKKVKPTQKMTTYKETSTATLNKKKSKKGKGSHKVHATDATSGPFITSTDSLTKTSDIKLSSSSDIEFSSKTHKKSKKSKKVKPTSKMTTYKETSTATLNKKKSKKGKGNHKVHATDATTGPFVTSTDSLTKTSDIKLSTSSDIGLASKTHKKSKKVKPTSKRTTYKEISTATLNKKKSKKGKGSHKVHATDATTVPFITSNDLLTKPSDKLSTYSDIELITETKHRRYKNTKNTKKVKPTSKMTTYENILTTTSNKKGTKKRKGNHKMNSVDATTVPSIVPSGLLTKTSKIQLSTVLSTPQFIEESTSHDTSTNSVLPTLTSSDMHERKSSKHKNNKKSTKREKINKHKSTTARNMRETKTSKNTRLLTASESQYSTMEPQFTQSKSSSRLKYHTNSHATFLPNSRSSLGFFSASPYSKERRTERPPVMSTLYPYSKKYSTKESPVPASKASLKFYSTDSPNSRFRSTDFLSSESSVIFSAPYAGSKKPGTRGRTSGYRLTVLPNSMSSLMFSSSFPDSMRSSKIYSTLYPDTTASPTFDSIVSNSKESSIYGSTISVTPRSKLLRSKASSRFDSTGLPPRLNTSPVDDSTHSPLITTGGLLSFWNW